MMPRDGFLGLLGESSLGGPVGGFEERNRSFELEGLLSRRTVR